MTKHEFRHRHLLSIEQLSREDISTILDRSRDILNSIKNKSPLKSSLRGFILSNVFLENSTRTRQSFEVAMKRLGGTAINMSVEGSSINKGEELRDTLTTLSALYPDALVLRNSEEGSAKLASEIMHCPVLNAGDGQNEHPTQALLDALTIRNHFNKISGLKIAIVGDIKHSRVAHSNKLLLEKMGANVVFAGPKELLPDWDNASTDISGAIKDADVVMTLRIQKERLKDSLSMTEEEYHRDWGITYERMWQAKPHAILMHPGPMNRGVEIDNKLADDPRYSKIEEQVTCGVAVRAACLELLIENWKEESNSSMKLAV